MHKLAQTNTAKLLDMLTARLVYERTGVRLYDGIIAKIELSADTRFRPMLETLRHNRAEEKEHEEWLEAQIRSLGGDPHIMTRLAELEDEESRGVVNVILDGHTEIPHLIHALLTAELADNAGWDLLVRLADEAGDKVAKREMQKRMAHEIEHLAFLREAMKRSAQGDVLGVSREMPSSVTGALASSLRKPLGAGMLIAGLAGIGATIYALVRRSRREQSFWARSRARLGLGRKAELSATEKLAGLLAAKKLKDRWARSRAVET